MKRKVAREKKSKVPFFGWAMESYRTSHVGFCFHEKGHQEREVETTSYYLLHELKRKL